MVVIKEPLLTAFVNIELMEAMPASEFRYCCLSTSNEITKRTVETSLDDT
jgi:hypothetical protein